jgi:hypothetical protein
MQIRRPGAKGYEEVDGVNIPGPPNQANGHGDSASITPEFELASVSVVPDGWLNKKHKLIEDII